MKRLSCKELGSIRCKYVATGKTAAEVKRKMFAHAKKAHPRILAKMTKAQMAKMKMMMDKLLAKQR